MKITRQIYCQYLLSTQINSTGMNLAGHTEGLDYNSVYRFAGATHLKLLRVSLSTERAEYIVTNDDTQDNTAEAQQESARRWKVEQFHREAKPLTGSERCECRLNRSKEPHLCQCAGLDVPQEPGLPDAPDGLPDQERLTV